MKGKEVTATGSIITRPDSDEGLTILLPINKNKDDLASYSFYDFMRFIDENKPESVSLYTANMHGKSIIFVLEGFMARKYKPFIYEFIIHKPGRPRMIIIKFLNSKTSNAST